MSSLTVATPPAQAVAATSTLVSFCVGQESWPQAPAAVFAAVPVPLLAPAPLPHFFPLAVELGEGIVESRPASFLVRAAVKFYSLASAAITTEAGPSQATLGPMSCSALLSLGFLSSRGQAGNNPP